MAKPIQLYTSIGFGIASFVIAFVLGSFLTMTTGIPLAGGLLNGILTGMVLTIGLISTNYFGSATIMWIVFSLCASITTTLGPPGIYKVVIGGIAGIIWDSIYRAAKSNSWGMYLGALLGSASIMFSLTAALTMGFGEGAAEALKRYKGAFYFILGVNLLVTFIGVYLGNIIYRTRLSNLQVFKNLSRYADRTN